jgi:hypothetical protein
MPRNFIKGAVFVTAIAVALPPPSFAQPKPASTVQSDATGFNVEQLDAMLAPTALYPDELLTQILMASTYPLQVVAASRWLEKNDNKNLKGDVLAKALESESWNPSVKSLVPLPQVIAMLNDNLEWTHQLGYAIATQQPAVLDSIQRLRRQAEKAGSLKTTEQQHVVGEENNVVIQPADPQTVYVPVYNPTQVYGEWPYPSYPPVYFPRGRHTILTVMRSAQASLLPPARLSLAGCGLGEAGLEQRHGQHQSRPLQQHQRQPAGHSVGNVAPSCRRGGRAAYSSARRTCRPPGAGRAIAGQCHRPGECASAGKRRKPAADFGAGGRARPASRRRSAAADRRRIPGARGSAARSRPASGSRCTSRAAACRSTTRRGGTVAGRAAAQCGASAIFLLRTASGRCVWQHGRRRSCQPI